MSLNDRPFGKFLRSDNDFHLPIGITVYVPSTKNKSEYIGRVAFDRRIKFVDDRLRRMFGGFTTISGRGGYTADNGKVIEERVAKVTTYVKKGEYIKKQKELLGFIRYLKTKFGQESIGYEIEGDLHYIS